MDKDEKDKARQNSQQEQKTDSDSSKIRSFADGLKRLLTVGSTAPFLTEEGIKTALGDIKLPKELLKPLLDSAMSSKDQVLNYISKDVAGEISKVINSSNFQKNIFKLLDTHKLKLSVEIEKKQKPSVKEVKNEAKDKNVDKKVKSNS